MSSEIDWNYFFPILGTVIGAILGFFSNYFLTGLNLKSERENAYRAELRSQFDEFIKPLFIIINNFSGTLPILQMSLESGKSLVHGRSISDLIDNCEDALNELEDIVNKNQENIRIYLPDTFEWIFVPYFEHIKHEIISEARKGEYPDDAITKAWNTARAMMKDIRKLLGFEINVKLDTKFPFE